MSESHNIHATGLVLFGHGVLIRGPSGAGKSLLALELLDLYGDRARLVADDRLDMAVVDGRLTMSAPQTIAGLIELRGRGIVRRPFVASAGVELVVDLVPTLERMPEASSFTTSVLGLVLPACPVPMRGVVDSTHQRLLITQRLAEVDDPQGSSPQIST